MKEYIYFLILLFSILILSAVNNERAIDRQTELLEAYSETITIYTTQDILYLEGKHLFTESGRIDIEFTTRSRALAFLEQLTADIANGLPIE